MQKLISDSAHTHTNNRVHKFDIRNDSMFYCIYSIAACMDYTVAIPIQCRVAFNFSHSYCLPLLTPIPLLRLIQHPSSWLYQLPNARLSTMLPDAFGGWNMCEDRRTHVKCEFLIDGDFPISGFDYTKD